MKFTESKWIPEQKLLITRLGGNVDLEDIKKWEGSLAEATGKIAPGSTFKAFINLYGFKAINLEAHKAMRNVVPLMLARYNFRAGYLDLFEDAIVDIRKTNGIACLAVAHVHNDVEKVKLYQERFEKDTERFFTDEAEGEKWIAGIQII